MTQEEKQLLLKDLCGRLPYGVKINIKSDYTREMGDIELTPYHLDGLGYNAEYRNLRPYLRPMSSMTEEEESELRILWNQDFGGKPFLKFPCYTRTYDFYNARHFDFRGLIEKGLALEAPEGMYKTK